jgi:hypothetical protein
MVRNRDQGFALVGVLLVTVSLLTVVSGILVYGNTTNKRVVNEESQARAFYAAESGISHAIAKFRALQEEDALPDTWAKNEAEAFADEAFVESEEGKKPQYKAWIYRPDQNSPEFTIIAQGEDRAIVRNVSVKITAPGLGGDGVIWEELANSPSCNFTSVTTVKGKDDFSGEMKIDSYNKDGILIEYDEIKLTSNGSNLTINVNGPYFLAKRIEVTSNTSVTFVKDPKNTEDVTICIKGGKENKPGLEINNSDETKRGIEFALDGNVDLVASQIMFRNKGRLVVGANTNLTIWADVLETNNILGYVDHATDVPEVLETPSTWPRIIVAKKLVLNDELGRASSRPVIVYLRNKASVSGSSYVYGAIWPSSKAPSYSIKLPSGYTTETFAAKLRQVPFPGTVELVSTDVQIRDYTNRL